MISTAADIEEAFRRVEAFRVDVLDGDEPASRRLTRHALEPVLASLGITRVGDLTDLDRLGIPVWSAARPGSRSLSVSAGKGMTHEAAWTSAVMESCEQALAEDAHALTALVESPRGLARRGLRSVTLERQSRCAARHLQPERELAWVKGLSWKSGEHVYAPFELVGMDMIALAPWNLDAFRLSSVGLASGGDLASALTHGLLELVEDDAMFGTLFPGAKAQPDALCFDPERGGELCQAVAMLAAAGVEARFCLARGDACLPVIIAALVPEYEERRDRSYFCGSGCHSTVEKAALAALLEAVQCRALFISGARDDLFEDEYGQVLTRGTEALFGGYRFAADPAGSRERATLNDIVSAITRDGVDDIYVFPLGGSKFGFDTVRILADDLVSMHGPEAHARTGRAVEKLLRQWAGP